MRRIILECTAQALARPYQTSISTVLLEFKGSTDLDCRANLDNFKQKLIAEEDLGDVLIHRRIIEVE